jgi:hypothetical protein
MTVSATFTPSLSSGLMTAAFITISTSSSPVGAPGLAPPSPHPLSELLPPTDLNWLF